MKTENQLQIICFSSTIVDNVVKLTEGLETMTKEWLKLPPTGSMEGRRKYSVQQILNFHTAQEIGSNTYEYIPLRFLKIIQLVIKFAFLHYASWILGNWFLT